MIATPKWTERYNCHRLVLAQGAITISVNWSSNNGDSGFRVQVNDIKLGRCVSELAEAKRAGADLARKIMQHATHELNLLRMAG